MKKIKRLTLASVVAVAVLAVPTILAAAKALATLTVSGPGINGALALTDTQGLLQLQQYGFFDTTTLTKAPQGLGAGYVVTGYLNLDGNPVAFEQGIYYPAIAGEQGYIHFTQAFDSSTMKPIAVDRWGAVSPSAAEALTSMLVAHGVTLQIGTGAQALQASPNLSHVLGLPYGLPLYGVICAGFVLVAGLLLRRRRGQSAMAVGGSAKLNP